MSKGHSLLLNIFYFYLFIYRGLPIFILHDIYSQTWYSINRVLASKINARFSFTQE